MVSRAGEIADGTTNWIPFILAVVFVLFDGTVFAVQSVSAGTQDFSNPWNSGPGISYSEIMRKTADDRQTTQYPHQFLQRQGSEGSMRSMIQHQLYCQSTGDVWPTDCPSNGVFSDDEYNESAYDVILSRSFLLDSIHSGNTLRSDRGYDGSLSVQQERVHHRFRFPLEGGRRATIDLQIGGLTNGGVLW